MAGGTKFGWGSIKSPKQSENKDGTYTTKKSDAKK